MKTLKLLSYNIHVGIAAPSYTHYLSNLWQHALPSSRRSDNLRRVADFCAGFDLVGLQETDAGSFRSGFVNIPGYIAEFSGHPFVAEKRNRNLGALGQHSLSLLSRYPFKLVEQFNLPAMIPGRGMIMATMENDVCVVVTHLALNKQRRLSQLDFIHEKLNEQKKLILMGDFNFSQQSREMRHLLNKMDLHLPLEEAHSYPSWKPKAKLDHILVSPSFKVLHSEVFQVHYSDHLPVGLEVELPA